MLGRLTRRSGHTDRRALRSKTSPIADLELTRCSVPLSRRSFDRASLLVDGRDDDNAGDAGDGAGSEHRSARVGIALLSEHRSARVGIALLAAMPPPFVGRDRTLTTRVVRVRTAPDATPGPVSRISISWR